MKMNEKSKWIWPKCIEMTDDMYGEFIDDFVFDGGDVRLEISASSDYTIFLNGEFIDSDQYPDFPHYKVYDDLDITKHCRKGKNRLAVIVWYYGKQSFHTYYPDKAALRYEVKIDDVVVSGSGQNVKSRISKAYKNGYYKVINNSIGLSFLYDITREDDWKTGEADGFAESNIVCKASEVFPRPVEKLKILPREKTMLIKASDKTHFLYDIGRETVGYLTFDIESSCEQKIVIAYGEHIDDGGVRRTFWNHDYSAEAVLKNGKNIYTNYFKRFGLRYIEVFAEKPIEINYIGVLPTEYPLSKIEFKANTEIQQRIYDVAVRTLELCMHEHYEDCPWREQSLYTLDARNQMLCGFYAFNEYRFPRSNLLLISKDCRRDGLLSICTPSSVDMTIPSFSLIYIIEVWEYTIYSKDISLIKEIYPKLRSIINVFIERMENDCLPIFTEKCYWNYYEWNEGLCGVINREEEPRVDAALNCFFVLALETMQKISDKLLLAEEFSAIADKVRRQIVLRFFDAERGLFINGSQSAQYSELVNSLAILCGAAGGYSEQISECLAKRDNDLLKISLSMYCYKYDALLEVNEGKYRDFVIADIERVYKKMLDAGATSFWETENSNNIDTSRCHAWSSMPVFYYHRLLKENTAKETVKENE